MINIEIRQGYKKNTWCIRVGDIEGSTEYSNLTKKELIKEIKSELKKEKELIESKEIK